MGDAVRRPSLPLIATITATGILNNTLIAPVLPDITDDFGLSDGAAGFIVAAGALPGIATAPLFGVAADRYGRRQVIIPALLIFGVFGALGALAPNYPTLLVLRLLQGVGSAALLNLAVTLIGDHYEGIDRARALGRNAAVLTVSIAVFPPVGGLLAELGGWRLTFVPYLVALATAVVVGRQLSRERPDHGEEGRMDLRAAVRYSRAPHLWGPMAMAFVAFVLIFGLFLTALPVHLEDEFGVSAAGRGLVLAVPALTSTLMAVRVGKLRGRYGARRLVVFAWTVFAVAFAGMWAAPAVVLVLAATLVYGLGEGLLIPTLQDLVAGGAPERGRGAVVALLGSAIRAGQTAGPLLAGAVLGIGTALPFGLGAALAAAVLFGVVLLRPAARIT